MKITIPILFLILLLFATYSIPFLRRTAPSLLNMTSSTTNQWKTYRNEVYGIQLSVPQDWDEEPAYYYNDHATIYFSNLRYVGEDRDQAPDFAGLAISIYHPAESLSSRRGDGSACGAPSGDIAVREETAYIGGVPTKLVTIDPRQIDWETTTPPVSDHACIERNGWVYVFSASGGADETWLGRRSVVNRILATVTFL